MSVPRAVRPGLAAATVTFSGGISVVGLGVGDAVLVGQLVRELSQLAAERHAGQQLIVAAAGFARTDVEHHGPIPHLVAEAARRMTDRDGIERRARIAQRAEHLIVVIVAELGALGRDCDDHRPLRVAFLEPFRGFVDAIEQVGAAAALRPEALDSLFQVDQVSGVVREDRGALGDCDDGDIVLDAAFARTGESGHEFGERLTDNARCSRGRPGCCR